MKGFFHPEAKYMLTFPTPLLHHFDTPVEPDCTDLRLPVPENCPPLYRPRASSRPSRYLTNNYKLGFQWLFRRSFNLPKLTSFKTELDSHGSKTVNMEWD